MEEQDTDMPNEISGNSLGSRQETAAADDPNVYLPA